MRPLVSLMSSSIPLSRRAWCALAALALVAIQSSVPRLAQGGTPTCAPATVRLQDELWLVDQRGLGCTTTGASPSDLRYWHYVPGVGWQRATSADFFATDDPAIATQIWIHGNQIDGNDAFEVGWTVYSSLARRATSEQPLRFVIWSWPSERSGGVLEDVRIKAARTIPASFHLARFIDAIGAEVKVSVMAYSFGARIALGALHLMGGGTINGQPLTNPSGHARPPLDVVLIAAAVDNDCLLPGHSRGQALNVVNRMFLVRNSCDKVLRFYRFLYHRRSCATALGYVGMGGLGMLGANAGKVAQLDACCLVGPEHYWRNYFASPAVVGRLLPYVFSATVDGTVAETKTSEALAQEESLVGGQE
jgi:hypothetical protein